MIRQAVDALLWTRWVWVEETFAVKMRKQLSRPTDEAGLGEDSGASGASATRASKIAC